MDLKNEFNSNEELELSEEDNLKIIWQVKDFSILEFHSIHNMC
jgi:hypothetical protein